MKLKINLITLALNAVCQLCLSPVYASQIDAEAWHHLSPIRSGEVTIQIDFQSTCHILPGAVSSDHGPSSFEQILNPIWINVFTPYLQNQDTVRAMLITYNRHIYRGRPYLNQETQELDLQFNEPGHFSGQLASFVYRRAFNDGYAFSTVEAERQEIVIWINGQIVNDPITGNNLSFNFSHSLNPTDCRR